MVKQVSIENAREDCLLQLTEMSHIFWVALMRRTDTGIYAMTIDELWLAVKPDAAGLPREGDPRVSPE